MCRKRFTEKKAQANVRSRPKPKTLPNVMLITIGVMSSPILASQSIKAFMAAKIRPLASNAETKPIQKACRIKGRLMNPHRAPTSFIV